MEKICWQITVAAFMQPLQYDLRSPAAKDNSITHAATAWSNLDAAITMRSAETELQNTIELRATASEIVAPKPDPDRRQSEKKTILKHFLKGFLEGKSLAPKTHFVRDFLQNSIGNSSTSTTCNPIYIAGTILQLQITMEFCRPRMHEKHLKPHLQCGTDPTMVREWSDHGPRMIRPHTRPSRTRRTAEVDHRRSGTHFVWKNIGFRASAISQKHISCETSFKIGNSSTSTTCNPIYSEGTILELQITMEFHRQLIHQHHLQSHLHCGNDPTVANHNGILSTAQMHETQVKPHLQCGTDPSMIRDMIRPWSENDPTTHETVSHPSHRRGRSSTFGDALCLEKHRVSCICYLSKTHFVRDFLQNSIGNSSTSTTCNPIYIAGTILQLQITMEFCRPHMHEKHLKPHLQPRGPSSQEKGVQNAKVHLARGNRLGREKILHHLQQPWTVKFHVPMCPWKPN